MKQPGTHFIPKEQEYNFKVKVNYCNGAVVVQGPTLLPNTQNVIPQQMPMYQRTVVPPNFVPVMPHIVKSPSQNLESSMHGNRQ